MKHLFSKNTINRQDVYGYMGCTACMYSCTGSCNSICAYECSVNCKGGVQEIAA